MSSTMSCLWDRAKNFHDLCFVLLDNVIFVRTVVPIDKLETVQNQTARFVTKRYDRMDSPSEMKRQLEWNSLQERRFVQRQSVIYKVHNQLTNYSLPIYCVPPARALKSHHKYSYQSIRALHDSVFCPGFQKGRVPSEKGTLAR